MARPKPLISYFGINYRLERCDSSSGRCPPLRTRNKKNGSTTVPAALRRSYEAWLWSACAWPLGALGQWLEPEGVADWEAGRAAEVAWVVGAVPARCLICCPRLQVSAGRPGWLGVSRRFLVWPTLPRLFLRQRQQWRWDRLRSRWLALVWDLWNGKIAWKNALIPRVAVKARNKFFGFFLEKSGLTVYFFFNFCKRLFIRGSVIETISIFLYVQPIFVDERVLLTMNQNFKSLSWL